MTKEALTVNNLIYRVEIYVRRSCFADSADLTYTLLNTGNPKLQSFR